MWSSLYNASRLETSLVEASRSKNIKTIDYHDENAGKQKSSIKNADSAEAKEYKFHYKLSVSDDSIWNIELD